MDSDIKCLKWSYHYSRALDSVRSIIPLLPALDKHLEKAYKEKQANIPFEFYKKLQAEVLPIAPAYQYCKIL